MTFWSFSFPESFRWIETCRERRKAKGLRCQIDYPNPKVAQFLYAAVTLHPAPGFPSAASLLFERGPICTASREPAWIPASA